jgi:hypothetical protein
MTFKCKSRFVGVRPCRAGSAPSSMNRARCLKERQLADRSLRGCRAMLKVLVRASCWNQRVGPRAEASFRPIPTRPANTGSDSVRNVAQWYGAFKVAPDEKLYLQPADRIRIW